MVVNILDFNKNYIDTELEVHGSTLKSEARNCIMASELERQLTYFAP